MNIVRTLTFCLLVSTVATHAMEDEHMMQVVRSLNSKEWNRIVSRDGRFVASTKKALTDRENGIRIDFEKQEITCTSHGTTRIWKVVKGGDNTGVESE